MDAFGSVLTREGVPMRGSTSMITSYLHSFFSALKGKQFTSDLVGMVCGLVGVVHDLVGVVCWVA